MSMETPICPICGAQMEKKHGKYGYFWGCTNFRKKGCRGIINIPIVPFEFEYIDYDGFVENNPTDYLLQLIETEAFPKYVKELPEVLDGQPIEKGTVYDSHIGGKISGIFEYLNKKKQRFTIAKLAYWFYRLDGELQGKLDYWLNYVPSNEHRKEYHIKKVLRDNWESTPFGLNGYSLYEEEYPIGEEKGDFAGYKVDIVAKDKLTDELIFIEVKGLRSKGREAMGQLSTYVRTYNKIHPDKKVKKAYIVCKGYPRGVFDDDLDFDIGMIGYIMEGDKLSFIPWKIV